MRQIICTRAAAKGLRKLGSVEATRVRAKIAQLVNDPAAVAGSTAALKGVDTRRLRGGEWCVIFRMEPDRLVILKIAHRREAYE